MQAIAHEEFGSADVLELRELGVPEPGRDDVLVQVRAASPNPWDWHFMRGEPYVVRATGAGLRRPRRQVLGGDLAGVVEAVGEGVVRFRPGDEVYCFVGSGGFAEYVAAREALLAHKPANLSFQQAAAVPLAGLTALQALRDAGRTRPGQRVLIVGASGGVGTFAVQLAKWLGAEVTGVCSTRNLELVRSIGADRVIDYTNEDVTRSGQRYDVIVQLAGTTSPLAFRRALTPKGTLVLSSGDARGRVLGAAGRMPQALLLSPFVGQALRPMLTKPRSVDLQLLAELIEAGAVTPVIDRVYPLREVPDAIRYLETGRARGKVVISVCEQPAEEPK
jgi:NADPH:quinone reductase-like Zn-dependent oxidoreductase